MPAVASPLIDDDGDDMDAPAKRRPWGPEEDEHLRSLVDVYGIKSWAQIATNLSNRNGKQCRERWRNHLRPQLNKGDWSAEEDCAIWDRVQEMGTKWAQVRMWIGVPLGRRPWKRSSGEHRRMVVARRLPDACKLPFAAAATAAAAAVVARARARPRDYPGIQRARISDPPLSPLRAFSAPQISELYMPQRTDNDIKNRWNSIIRKSNHPSGREWSADENDARAAILGSASRTQVRNRKEGGGEDGEGATGTAEGRPAAPPRERKRQRTVGSGGLVNGASSALGKASSGGIATLGDPAKVGMRRAFTEADADVMEVGAVGTAGKHDDISPDGPQARKLFESPDPVPFEGLDARDAVGVGGGVPRDDDDDVKLKEVVETASGGNLNEETKGAADSDEVLPPSDAAEACRMLVGGEISSDTFDVDAFLPLAAASMGSLSQMNSPMADGKAPNRAPSRVAQDWFDPELDSSLSPILTPSLRHQLRALMASKSPTPHAGAQSSGTSAAASTSPPGAPYSATSLLAAEMASVERMGGAVRSSGRRSGSKEAAASSYTPGGSRPTPSGSASASGGRMCLTSALSAAIAASSSTVSSLTSALSAAAGAATSAAKAADKQPVNSA